MAVFEGVYSGAYGLLYDYKLKRFKYQLQKDFKRLQAEIKREPKEQIDLTRIKKVLVIKNEAFGDMILITPLIRHLALNGYQVDVLASEANQVIIEHNPYVHQIIAQTGGPEKAQLFVLEQMQSLHYDLVIDARYPIYYDDPKRLLFPQHISCEYLISWNRSNIGIYDHSVDYDDGEGHFTGVINAFLNFLGIDADDCTYDLPLDAERAQKGLHYVRDRWREGGPVIVLNPFASQTTRDLKEGQFAEVVERVLQNYPFAQIVCIGLPERLKQIQVEHFNRHHLHLYTSENIMDVVALIQYADAVISPDTSIIHIASAFQKPTVGLYIASVRDARDAKEKAKRDYYQAMQLLKDQFFDQPQIEAGLRRAESLLNDFMFAPHNERARQIFSNTGDMSGLEAANIVNALSTLLREYVDDEKYVLPAAAVLQLTHEKN